MYLLNKHFNYDDPHSHLVVNAVRLKITKFCVMQLDIMLDSQLHMNQQKIGFSHPKKENPS